MLLHAKYILTVQLHGLTPLMATINGLKIASFSVDETMRMPVPKQKQPNTSNFIYVTKSPL